MCSCFTDGNASNERCICCNRKHVAIVWNAVSQCDVIVKHEITVPGRVVLEKQKWQSLIHPLSLKALIGPLQIKAPQPPMVTSDTDQYQSCSLGVMELCYFTSSWADHLEAGADWRCQEVVGVVLEESRPLSGRRVYHKLGCALLCSALSPPTPISREGRTN